MSDSDDNLVAHIEDDPIAKNLPERPTFIPLRQVDLLVKLVSKFKIKGDELSEFRQLASRLQAIFHVEHLSALLHLEELYAPLDPDSQLLDLDTISSERRDTLANTLLDRLSGLLYSAHYKRLTRKEIEQAIEVGWQWGVQLDVNFDLFERLDVFARGYRTVVVARRRWQNLFMEETIELPEFQRLIMAFRVKADEQNSEKKRKKNASDDPSLENKYVYLKTFKNIPETDLEILLPGSKVRLTKMDRAKILLPTLSGAAITIYKITRGLLVLSFVFVLSVKVVLGWLIFIGVSAGYVIKSVLSYFRTKNKYQFGLTKSLYLKNLDNNQSVIYRIMNEAEEQEVLEAILAYTFLWKAQPESASGFTGEELDLAVEKFLNEFTESDIDFEIHDALGKLARLGLAHVCGDGKWTATPIDSAMESLNRNWNALFQARARSMTNFESVEDDLFTS